MLFDYSLPIKLRRIMIIRPINGTARGHFLEMPITLSHPYPNNKYKDDSIPRILTGHYKWTTK
jgi:hypothetical protein